MGDPVRSRYASELRKREARPGRTWYLDEMAVRIRGKRHWLWRAVDEHGEHHHPSRRLLKQCNPRWRLGGLVERSVLINMNRAESTKVICQSGKPPR